MSQETINSNPLLDTDQAAKYMGRNPSSMTNDRCMGRGIEYVKIGKLVRYQKSTLDAAIEKNIVRPGSDA